jgi:WD40 repeat protein
LSGGTQVQLVPDVPSITDGIDSTTEAYFGASPATDDVAGQESSTGGSYNFLTATTPPATATGPVTVLMTDANNDAVFFPSAFSYGPHAHWIDPSALSPAGGTDSILWADGMEVNYANHPSVLIGGAAAGTAPPDFVPVPLQEITVSAPAGNPGWADLKLSLSDGTSETTKNMVQYLAKDVTLTSVAYTSAVYDSTRDRFYLTGADNTVGVFDPATQTLLQPMLSSTASASAVFGSLALTPDNSKLLVSDPTDHSVVVFDLTANSSVAVDVLLPSDGGAQVSGPMPVVALAGDKAFALLTGWDNNEVRQIDLTQMTVTVRTDVRNTSSFSVAPSTMAASTDGSTVLLGGATPGSPTTYYVWQYDASSDAFTAPTTVANSGENEVAVNADGSVLGMGAYTLDQNQLPLVPFPFTGYITLLPGTGALRFSVGSEVEISDTHNGKHLLSLGFSGTPYIAAFAVDPGGQKILICCSSNSLGYYELAVVPLAVATVSPATVTPGASLTVRGSGFVAGTAATIAGVSASCTMVDAQTLQCGVLNANAGLAPMTLSNPDGQTYSMEGAVTVQ